MRHVVEYRFESGRARGLNLGIALMVLVLLGGCGGMDPLHSAHPHMNPSGCSDGEREGFRDLTTHPDIAACAGAWSLPGIVHSVVMCDRRSGDDSSNTEGIGCSAADLCARGWHMCATTQDFSDHTFTGCDGLDADQAAVERNYRQQVSADAPCIEDVAARHRWHRENPHR